MAGEAMAFLGEAGGGSGLEGANKNLKWRRHDEPARPNLFPVTLATRHVQPVICKEGLNVHEEQGTRGDGKLSFPSHFRIRHRIDASAECQKLPTGQTTASRL